MAPEDQPPYEIVLNLPELLDGPVTLQSGEILSIGDMVEHVECGIGTVVRFSTYHDHMGILVFVEFPNDRHELLGLTYVKKVNSPSEKSP